MVVIASRMLAYYFLLLFFELGTISQMILLPAQASPPAASPTLLCREHTQGDCDPSLGRSVVDHSSCVASMYVRFPRMV